MPEFRYKARDRKGALVEAVIEAEDIRKAVASLREKGYYVVEIRPPGQGLRREISFRNLGAKRPGLKDVAVFARQMATMISAGITVTHALEILEQQMENPTFRKIAERIRLDIEGGEGLSDAMAKHKVFSRLFVSLVRSGEAVGGIDTVLDRVATFLEKEMAIRGKIKTAMTYPTIVLVFAMGIAYFMLAFIVPQFANILTDLGSELPLLTRFLIAVSILLRKGFPLLALLLVGSVVAYRMAYRNPKGRLFIDRAKLRLPVFGPIIRKNAVATFCRTMNLLLSGGQTVIEALDIAKGTANNGVLEGAIEEARKAVEQGQTFREGLTRAKGIFPPMMVSMAGIGEETGALDTMLSKVADFYEREVEEAIGSLSAAIEPLLIVFLGGIVGLIVVGMFLPLFQVINTLSTM